MNEPKLCECGCGRPTPLATHTSKKHGRVKGQPTSFIHGHHRLPPSRCEHEPKYGLGLCRACYKREWDKANPDKAATHWRKHKAAHAGAYNAYGREWSKANLDKRRVSNHRRKARKKNAGGSWTAAQWETLKRQYGYRCVNPACWKTEKELKVLGGVLAPTTSFRSIKAG